MDGHEDLAERFEANRAHLRAVAYRMLGSTGEADDAVQEAWLRLSRAGSTGVENLRAWLTTVVGRVCLDMLRSRTARREEPMPFDGPGTTRAAAAGDDPERDAVLADSVGLALLVVLDTLAPAERLAFVLHDLFGVPFDEIATIVGRSPDAARQLASRGRRRVHGAGPDGDTIAGSPPAGDADPATRRAVVAAFLAAARGGDFDTLVALLDPDVVVRADAAAVRSGATPEVRGATAVAETFAGRAAAARPTLVDGAAGLAWAPGGKPRVVFAFGFAGAKVATIDLVADPDRLAGLDVVFLDA